MNIGVQRLRFANWTPSPIVTLASDPFSAIVAIGREDGDIEISSHEAKWHTMSRICGQNDFDLKQLVFAKDALEAGRLFGISTRGFLFEVDFNKLSICNVRDSYGGAVWALAAHFASPHLALGVEDGSVKIFSYADGGLEYVKALPTTGHRILSVAYHPKITEQLFAGCVDGTIRCYNETTGLSLYRLTGDVMRGAVTQIWCLRVLSDSTIISGDNRGTLQFWDGNTGTLRSSSRQHTAPILAIAVSPDETRVFASGVDSRVTYTSRVGAANDYDWVHATSHRPHSHDVHALEVAPIDISLNVTDANYVLLSGGVDTKLCEYSVADYARVRPSWIFPVNPNGLVASSADASIIALMHRTHVDVWQQIVPSWDYEVTQADDTNLLRCRVQLKGDDYISCICLTPKADMLFIGSARGLRAFHLHSITEKDVSATVTAISLPKQLSKSVIALAVSNDGARLAVGCATGTIFLCDVTGGVAVVGQLSFAADMNSYSDDLNCLSRLRKTVRRLSFNCDGSWLIATNSANSCLVYDIDRLNLHTQLPDTPSCITCAAFHPSSPSSVVLTLTNNTFLIYDVNKAELCEWSIQNTSNIPKLLLNYGSPIEKVIFHPKSPNSMLLYGQGFLVVVDLDEPIPNQPKQLPDYSNNHNGKPHHNVVYKGKRNTSAKTHNFCMINTYRSIVNVAFNDVADLVVLENPWVRVIDSLPDTLARKRYGT